MPPRRSLYLAFLAVPLLTAPAAAWWPKGHSIVAEAAVRSLPAEVPAFFRRGTGMAAHCAQDPDVFKQRETAALNDAEGPEHYVDLELLQGKPLPDRRSAYLKLLHELKQEPGKVGTLPYSVAEWTEKLAVAFAEHRKWPANPYIQTKCLVYAGILAHYSGDLAMPLHTTVHHDGRARPDGASPRTGIHARVDSLIEKLQLQPADLARNQQPEAFDALLPAISREIERSRALVDRTYELEPRLPPTRGDWSPSPEIMSFTQERARAAARFTASLYLTAWRKSASVQLPAWLEREEVRVLPARVAPPAKGPRLATPPRRK
jgi:hypothetical protein